MKKGRPSYPWYYGFMTSLQKFQEFLSERNLLDKPHKIYNADGTGFTMGSKAGVVVGATRQIYTDDVPHLSGGSTKQRKTVMYCASVE